MGVIYRIYTRVSRSMGKPDSRYVPTYAVSSTAEGLIAYSFKLKNFVNEL